MNVTFKLLCYAALLTGVVLGGLFMDTHREWLRTRVLGLADRAGEPGTAPASRNPSAGRHALTESPPMTVADLDRLVSVGFTTEQTVSEIERRGVLHLPEPTERDHILALPSGSRLLDAMDSPKNLLDDSGLAIYGKQQAGAPNLEQLKSTRQAMARQAVFQTQAGLLPSSSRQQLMAEFQRRQAALNSQIAALLNKRGAMQRRGEITASITMEIDRLKRERDALVPPL